MANARARPAARARLGQAAWLAAIFLVISSWPGKGAGDAAPKVVATILPLHSLVAAVMAGVGTPDLMIPGGASPHAYALRPSDTATLAEADVVFWVGEGLEAFLAKPLATLAGRARVAALAEMPGLVLLPARAVRDGAGDRGGSADPHVWLDPRNARAAVEAIAATLSAADPSHAETYRRNAAATAARLDRLDRALAARLAPVQDIPFIAFHDALRYFEARYGLTSAGTVVAHPERPPGARRVRALRTEVLGGRVRCVLAEPQFAPALLETLVSGSAARLGTVDPLGADIPPGPGAYFALMEALAAAIVECLGR